MRRFERPIVLALFACWVIGFGVLTWSASQRPPEEHNSGRATHTEQKAKPPTPQDRAFIEPQPDPTNEKSREHQKGVLETFFEIKLTDVLLVFFTAVLAYRTSGLFVETAGLRDAADKQRLDSLRSIAAAETAAKAAEKSAEVAERALLAANNPIITITELELRDANEAIDKPHIHWGLRNSGPGMGIVHTMHTRTGIGIVTPDGTKVFRSKEEITWGSAIESKDTATGFSITTPTLQSRIGEIRAGSTILTFAIQTDGQNIFKDRFSALFSFKFDHLRGTFVRVGTEGPKEANDVS